MDVAEARLTATAFGSGVPLGSMLTGVFDLARIEDGKIVEHWKLLGMFALLRRLGAPVVPPES